MTNNPQISTSRFSPVVPFTIVTRRKKLSPSTLVTSERSSKQTELHFSMSAWFRPSNATASAQASAFDKQVGVIIADEGKLLFATIEGGHSLKCRKGANRVTLAVGRPLPVYPDERTSSVYSGMCNTNPLCRSWIN
jgi:hypothetical protein